MSFRAFAKKNKITYLLKDIEPEVTPANIMQALNNKGFNAKTVFNILNKERKPLLQLETNSFLTQLILIL